MALLSVFHHYLFWHYSRAWREVLNVWLNYVWFVIQFFSIPQLLGSWFSPFKRIVEERGNKWDLEDLANYIIIGLISRIIGGIMRTIIILIGLIVLAITIVLGLVIIISWFFAPLAVVVLFFTGIGFLFM